MTRNELATLDVFIGEFREFRDDDRGWKDDIDKRLLSVEKYVTSKQAVSERDASRGVIRRSYIAATIAAAGVVLTIILRVWPA